MVYILLIRFSSYYDHWHRKEKYEIKKTNYITAIYIFSFTIFNNMFVFRCEVAEKLGHQVICKRNVMEKKQN